MEERSLILPLEKSTFQNIYISPGELKRSLVIEKTESNISSNTEISETEKLKAKIFTRELEDLIKKVASKKKELENIDRPIAVVPKGKELLYDYISLAYTQPDNQKLISEILIMIFDSHNIKSFILSNYYSTSGMFEPIYSGGIKEITKKSYRIHASNPLIKGIKNSLLIRNINVIKENIFFEKYFRAENLSQYENISFFNFDVFHNPFLLTILNFNHNTNKKSIFDELKILEDLEALFPVLNLNNFKDREKTIENTDLTNQINIFFKQKLNNSNKKNIYINKVIINNYFSAYDRIKRKNEITSLLQNLIEDDDIILESMYNKFFILSETNYKNQIYESLIKKLGNGNEFTLETYNYPDEINNFYLCF